MGAQLRAPKQGQKGPFQGRSRGGTLGPCFDPKSFRYRSSGTLGALKVATLELLFRGVPFRSFFRGGTAERLGHFEGNRERTKMDVIQ